MSPLGLTCSNLEGTRFIGAFMLVKQAARNAICYLPGSLEFAMELIHDSGNGKLCLNREVTELKEVWWLEIRGKFKVNILSHDTTYAAYLIFQLKGQAYRWKRPAQSFIRLASNVDEDIGVELRDIEDKGTFVYLKNPNEDGSGRRGQLLGDKYPQKRLDGWMEIELGVPFNSSDQNLSSVEIMFWEKTATLKTGLIVEGIELRVVE